MVGLVAFYFVGSLLGFFIYFLWRGARAVTQGPQPLEEWQLPAGRIHLFSGDRYFDSSLTNAYEHPELNWADGRIGCGYAVDLQARPELQVALLGTIQIYKPEWNRGHAAVILDNQVLQGLGLPLAGLNDEAQQLVNRIVPKQTLRG
ncbi:hypothetical protein [Pseudomonas oryziphila]|uniref:Uncharacterized protein n=1 Tax=Pseudomonas oryziphila TaxID=2894079 RepID=A0ABM7CR92_9PSED|nr:hypothetical protein [Pseudomonas oryziphila]AZL73955.1 hypothetical protein EI693_13025 [Pseudomonas oryziphila]